MNTIALDSQSLVQSFCRSYVLGQCLRVFGQPSLPVIVGWSFI